MNNLAQRLRPKLYEWTSRYMAAEVIGIIFSFSSAWISYKLTRSLMATAMVATVGENVGFYGTMTARELRCYWHLHGNKTNLRKIHLAVAHVLRNITFEFGGAELADSFIVRPGLFYLIPTILHGNLIVGLPMAKVLADCGFYGLAIIGYELRKKIVRKRAAELANKGKGNTPLQA